MTTNAEWMGLLEFNAPTEADPLDTAKTMMCASNLVHAADSAPQTRINFCVPNADRERIWFYSPFMLSADGTTAAADSDWTIGGLYGPFLVTPGLTEDVSFRLVVNATASNSETTGESYALVIAAMGQHSRALQAGKAMTLAAAGADEEVEVTVPWRFLQQGRVPTSSSLSGTYGASREAYFAYAAFMGKASFDGSASNEPTWYRHSLLLNMLHVSEYTK